MKKIICFFLIIAALTSFTAFAAKSAPESAEANFRNLCVLINQRLSCMKDVAAYKHKNNIPIEDLARERIVLLNSTCDAAKFGLSPEAAKEFFQLQINLAKKIQKNWIAKWSTEDMPEKFNCKDLKTEIRPELIKIGRQIILQLKSLKHSSLPLQVKQQIVIEKINVKYISKSDKLLLLKAILKLQQQ
ncbi:gamma subclass chorismate mutase AroQ [Lentisphaerota bacterium ZTH]|nr:gamma subclass chorismate mutase AroQ [Lentisphaerota bacterium]WET05427.1 gamma subclass chorismate mutase AroQ [Lentisphaerota bacterium ZTH]